MKTIIDEFTNLPVSRGRKWQLRKARDGKCMICGEPAVTGNKSKLCLRHLKYHREYYHKYNGYASSYKNTKYLRILNRIRRHRSVVW